MKKTLCILLTVILLLNLLPPLTAAAEERETVPSVYFIYSDIQPEKSFIDSSYNWWTYPATHWMHQLATKDTARGVSCDGIFYLAQNEREGMQIYFTEPAESTSARDITLEVSAFQNAGGETLHSEIYQELYLELSDIKNRWSSKLYPADPLVPYHGEAVSVQPDSNQAFYVEVRSEKDQTPGAYYATVTYSDDLGVIDTKTIAAVVWDFALPEQHYATMITGLYNASSGYGSCLSFLKQNGVRTYTYTVGDKVFEEIEPDDIEKAEQILEGWQEYLLDHGIMTEEIPRFLMDMDEKAAELSLADIRQKYFSIPILNWEPTASGTYDAATLAEIDRYKWLIGDNDYLTAKSFFYLKDEINPLQTALVEGVMNAAEAAWPQIKRMITYNGKGGDNQAAVEALDPYTNYMCICTSLLCSYYSSSTYDADLASSFINDFPYKWRYPSEPRTGGFELWLYGNDAVGVFRRYPFWEQHNNNEDGLLYWNCGYYPNNHNVIGEGKYPSSGGSATNNGNGYLLYPGAAVGEDIDTPIPSLRLKQIASGIDDADYLALADEFLPEGSRPTWTPNYNATRAYEANVNRINLGNQLEQATIEHTFGEWHTVVEPDTTHNGLKVRACTVCGTEESCEIDPIDPDEREYLIGDAAGSGAVTILDATLIQRVIAGLQRDKNGMITVRGDVNENGELDILDATAIQHYLADYHVTEPVGVYHAPLLPPPVLIEEPTTEVLEPIDI